MMPKKIIRKCGRCFKTYKLMKTCAHCGKRCCAECSHKILCIDCYVKLKYPLEQKLYYHDKYSSLKVLA